MGDIKTQLNELSMLATDFLSTVSQSLPKILGAIILLTIGWYVARFAALGLARMLRTFNVFLQRHWHVKFQGSARISSSTIKISSSITKWFLFFLVFAGTSRLFGVETFSILLNQTVEWLPSLIAGCTIIFVGVIASQFVRDFVAALTRTSSEEHAYVFGRLSQILVVVTALVMGVGQAGIDTTLLVSIITILLVGLFGGLALAFGLGANVLVSNLIGTHHAANAYAVGQTITIGDIKGEILRMTPTSAILSTEEGLATIPGRNFLRETVFVIDDVEEINE